MSSCPTTSMDKVKKNMIKVLEPGLKSPELEILQNVYILSSPARLLRLVNSQITELLGFENKARCGERNQLERNVPCGAAAGPMVRVGGADRQPGLQGAVTLMTWVIPV